jgi:hypothetical protein
VTAVEAPVELPALAGLEPIGLEQLVARAGLQTRVDRKYVLPLAAVGEVLTALAATERIAALEIGERRTFGYESVYFDTADLASYHLSARGRRRRFKVRRRTYLDSGESYVEVKTVGIRGATVKERVPAETGGPLPGAFVEAVLAAAGIDAVRSGDLRPVLRTAYRRSTLYLPATDGRVTVDTDLTWSVPSRPGVVLRGVAIVETKSTAGASAADRRLWRYGHRPTRVSKYGTGLASLREDLPANKWCPVLRRHFAAASPLTTCSSDDRNPS